MRLNPVSLRGLCGLVGAALLGACGGAPGASGTGDETARATIGPAGGEIVRTAGSALEGVRVQIPAGALSADTAIEVKASASNVPLPKTAARCGPEISIEPSGLGLAVPATVTLPFDENAI